MAGYGRGYYGEGQLEAPQRRKRSWTTIAAVVGLGAAAAFWAFWPRDSMPKHPLDRGGRDDDGKQTPEPSTAHATIKKVVAEPTGALWKQLQDDARARGFVSVKDYEDSVVASAKALQDSGAKVVLADNLQHLAPRLESRADVSKQP